MKTDLEMRVERLLGGAALSGPRPAAQVVEPLVSIPVWCSVTGKTNSVIAKRQGNTLCLLRNEHQGSAGPSNRKASPLTSFGKCRFEDGGWPGCPHCGAKSNSRKNLFLLWTCDKEACGFPLHCVGERGSLFRCACGIAADYNFHSVPTLEVRGSKAGCTSGPKAIANPKTAIGPSFSLRLPSTTLQLTYKGK